MEADGSRTVTGVAQRYGATAIALHWLTAILIVVNLALGLSMVPLAISPRKLQWYVWHKAIGITVLLLTGLRLSWRMIRPPPPPVAMPAWQRRGAAVAHASLYVLLVAVPVSGWLYSSATGVQVVYLGAIPLPNLVPRDRVLGDALKLVHVALNSVMFLLVCIHVAAALKHHYVDRDATLQRMLPLGRRRKGL
ncbi:MAG TPA: cytochrome b [Casimicrobiaceae bacterium]|nr:cytochrome b [Casimicrobiaceae bacterium]